MTNLLQFNPSALLENVDHDVELLKKVLILFSSTYSNHIMTIRSALEEKEFEKLSDAAHELKGELLVFGYEPAIEFVKSLEQRARNKDSALNDLKLDELDKIMGPILEFIKNPLITEGQ